MDRQALINTVRDRAGDHSPLGLVKAAVEVAEDVNAVADGVVHHYVDEARAAGHSWGEIGDVLGVTRQAVHHRFVKQAASVADDIRRLGRGSRRGRNPVFTRLSGATRQAVVRAAGATKELGHGRLGTEHLLLGVLADETCRGARALAALGVDHATVVAAVEEMVGRGTTSTGSPPFSPRAKRVFESALSHALKRSSNRVDTDHFVHALLDSEGVATRILVAHGVNHRKLDAEVAELADTDDEA